MFTVCLLSGVSILHASGVNKLPSCTYKPTMKFADHSGADQGLIR
jgi:hypothetical protein